MNPLTLKNTLVKTIKAGYPILITGAPGIGKTDVVHQAAREAKADLIVSHPAVSDPTDAKGLPAEVNGEAVFLPYGELLQAINAKKRTVWFFDDLGQAPNAVQAAYMQLFRARRINGTKISDKIVFIAATNRRQDRAGVTGVLEPVKSRFHSILELHADITSWGAWAANNDVAPELVNFLRWKPELLSSEETSAEIVNHPCPRTWESVNDLYFKIGLTDMEVIGGAVGEGAAVEFIGYIKLFEDLPDLDTIFTDPNTAIVPSKESAIYAVCSSLVRYADKKNVESIVTYANRLPVEFATMLIRDCLRKEGDQSWREAIQCTHAFIEWSAKHADVLV